MISIKSLFQNRSFAFKFTLLTTIPVVLVAMSIAVIASKRLESSITDSTFVRVKQNTYLAALSMSNQYVVYNKALLDTFVESLNRENDISYAFVVDYHDGRILAHTDHSKDGEYYEAPSGPKLQLRGAGTDGIVSLPGMVFEAVSPIRIGEDLFGTIRVGFSLDSVEKEIKLLRLTIAAATVFVVIISIFLSVLLANLFSKPLLALANQAQEVAEGNFDQEITYESRDVVGKLSRAFKKMTGELRERINEIESNERKFRALFEASNDAVMIIHENLITDCNYQTMELFKGKKDQILKRSLSGFSPEIQPGGIPSSEAMNKKIKETISGIRHRFDWRLNCANGSEIEVEISLSPTIISSQVMILAVVHDITERKKAEAEIENLNQTLEKRVEERTSELQDTQDAMLNLVEDLNNSKKELEVTNLALRNSEKKADSANRAKSEFLANMSHEIRTPLNAIVGLTYLTKQTELTKRQHDYLLKIDSSADTLLTVINDILDFSKIEAGKLSMESSEFYLEDVLNKVADVISMKADEKGLELIFTSDGKTPDELVGDPLRLGQVLMNLAGNAIKFTEKGEVIIRTTFLGRDGDKVKIKFDVEDTGIGISAEQRRKLFKAFSQADTSISRKFGGTGLGLVICKRIIGMMGGEIELASEPGKGSCFSFTALFGIHENFRKWPMVLADDFKGKKALVVDDSRTARQALRRILESMKLEVTMADSGEEALKILKISQESGINFDMVFTDFKMPLMDGLETAKNIKNNKNLESIPIIIMVTAFGKDEVIQKAQEIGLDGFITKPVSPSTILDGIMEAFGRKNGVIGEVLTEDSRPESGLETISGARILLAEDNEVNQQVAVELLSSVGMDVTLAENGREVLDLLERQSFDCIFMDIQMPVMDGLATSKRIRSLNSQAKDIPIIALTAHAMTGDREKSLESGMNDHITKPLDPEELFKALVKWIKPFYGGVKKPLLRDFQALNKDCLLPELPGLDTYSAIKRVGGKPYAYMNILNKFAASQLNSVIDLSLLIENGDMDKASKSLHALKGVAGNIGAEKLRKAAADLEVSVGEGKMEGVKGMIHDLGNFLKEVLSSIERLNSFFKEEKAVFLNTEDKFLFDIEEVKSSISSLKELLGAKKFSAGSELARLEGLLKNSGFGSQIADLKKNVERYRFKEGLKSLEILARSVNHSGDEDGGK